MYIYLHEKIKVSQSFLGLTIETVEIQNKQVITII